MKKHELRQECLKQNLPASGSVKILVKRLKENYEIVRNVRAKVTGKLCESFGRKKATKCTNPQHVNIYSTAADEWFTVAAFVSHIGYWLFQMKMSSNL